MTIDTEIPSRNTYSGNGVTTAFSTSFPFLASSDLVVIVRSSTGVETTKALTTDYTVSGGSGSRGTVTMLTPPASGEKLVIYNDPSITQTRDYVANDPFPAESHEQALDRLTMICTRLNDRVDRSVQISDGYAATIDLTLPAPEAGKVLLWNSGATALTNAAITDLISTGESTIVIADLLSLPILGGFASDHNSFDSSRSDARIWTISDRLNVGAVDTLTFQREYKTVTSVTRSGSTATYTCAGHGYSNGDVIQHGGWVEAEYCGQGAIFNVTANTFDRTVTGTPTTPGTAVGTPKCSKPDGGEDAIELERAGTVRASQAIFRSAEGYIGSGSYSVVSDNNAPGMDCIGGEDFVLNDGSVAGDTATARYIEARRAGPGSAVGVESNSVNSYNTTVRIKPYDFFKEGMTADAWFMAGGEPGTCPRPVIQSSLAVGIGNNGASHLDGIVFHAEAIDNCDGVTGTGPIITAAKGHAIEWHFDSTGDVGARIRSDVLYRTKATQIVFSDEGLVVQSIDDTEYLFQVEGGVTTAVNGLKLTPGTTGVAATLSAIGETNVGLTLKSKGTGEVNLYVGSVNRLKLTSTPSTYVAPTGTTSRATFDTATVTTAQLAQRVKALIEDLQAMKLVA